MRTAPRWDLFCRVIDNHGDLGVCWRLAADLAARGVAVRLWVDDASALAWMAPAGAAGVELVPWTEPAPALEPGAVVVEAFGCAPPADFVARMAARPRPPAWVNLEYLSAEDYVERSHRLPSPQRNGLVKWFFYPGFTPRTGGLLREPGLMAAIAGCDRAAWLAAHGIVPQRGERLASLFCYPNPRLPQLLDALAEAGPVLLLATPGAAQQAAPRPGLRVQALPWLTQPDYDCLLWSCDLNVVRGEDSFVRAHWAGRPFLWHIYPQHDGAHGPKLDAWLSRMGAPATLRATLRAWNGLAPWSFDWPDAEPFVRWREALLMQEDLTTALLGFAAEKR